MFFHLNTSPTKETMFMIHFLITKFLLLLLLLFCTNNKLSNHLIFINKDLTYTILLLFMLLTATLPLTFFIKYLFKYFLIKLLHCECTINTI